MSSHSWLLIVTVAVCATTIVCNTSTQKPVTDDPLINKILSTTTEGSKPNVPSKKWTLNPDDTR